MSDRGARRTNVVKTKDNFWAWVNDANPGDWCQYHIGWIIWENTGRLTDKGLPIHAKIPTAQAAWEAYMLGLVILVQRRIHAANAMFVWLAQKRARGAKPPVLQQHFSSRTLPQPDWCGERGAEALAEQLEAFWRDAGHPEVWAKTFKVEGPSKVWGVKTNLIGGQPPSLAAKAAVVRQA